MNPGVYLHMAYGLGRLLEKRERGSQEFVAISGAKAEIGVQETKMLVAFDAGAYYLVTWNMPEHIQIEDEVLIGRRWIAMVHPLLAGMSATERFRLFETCWIRRLAATCQPDMDFRSLAEAGTP